MKVKQITLGSSTLVLAALLTACGGSSSSGVQKPTPLVANTNNHGNHNASNPGNHNANNPANPTPSNPVPKWDATVRYGLWRSDAMQEVIKYVEYYADVTPKIDGYALTIDGRTQNGDIDLSKYPKGHHTLNMKETVTGKIHGQRSSITLDSKVYLFKQDYSLIAGIHNQNVTMELASKKGAGPVNATRSLVWGASTLSEKLPTTGKFNYSGSGKIGTKYGVRDAKFSYEVDFAEKTGSGSLDNITLSKGEITKVTNFSNARGDKLSTQGIEGRATDGRYAGEYALGFFGPDADEIVGLVELGDKDVVGAFGGTKQAQ